MTSGAPVPPRILKSGHAERDTLREVTTRPVLRVFISSTAIDLQHYRDKVRDAVLRLEDLPLAMETFSALSGQPTCECMRMAAEADAVICIVAHRYCYVPRPDLGGDGERSITWLEVDAAKRARKPVFAFLVDPKAPWPEIKEQDRLVTEPEKGAEIVQAVQKLQEFKAYLERECTRQTFTNPDDLAKNVAIALANLNAPHVSTGRVWKPLLCHALQPAHHFRGRESRIQELREWLLAPVTADRVVSLVAAGGTGKTALVHQALHQATLSGRAGVFVWSFYEDPHTDAFLRAAYFYFTGEHDPPTGGMLERLQLALSGDAPHILILDGLERVQSEGDHRRRGELEDLQLKRLLRTVAGGVGNARALVTSRFPLVDLDEWTGTGHRAMMLDDLELMVALEVLRAWKVKGDDAVLTRQIEPLNIGATYHALSLAVLGSYLGNFGGEFSFEDAQGEDPKSRKLSRILEEYTKVLTSVERDLLARLALFPQGVKIEFLHWIVQSGGDVAGTLVGLADRELVRHLDRLKALGLVFRYKTDGQAVYSAHPFLRDFFRNLVGAKPESVHESVCTKLALGLELRPEAKPRDPAILDRYELLIEETLLAGRVKAAFDLYWYGLGNNQNLGWVLGENARGLRILERFVSQGDFSLIESDLPKRARAAAIGDLGHAAISVGDLDKAREAFAHGSSPDSGPDAAEGSIYSWNFSEIELLAGNFGKALKYAESAVSLAKEATEKQGMKYALVFRAVSHFALGDTLLAASDFQHATELEGKPLHPALGILEAECKSCHGDRTGAISQARANREYNVQRHYNDDLCRCNALLARLLLTYDPGEAARHLQDARTFADRSGVVEFQLRCFQAACELQRHLGDYAQSIAEGEAGILLAETCGFGKYSIDIRLTLAETYLAAGSTRKALQNARNSLDRSEHPECRYAWGQADGFHLCGLAHLRLGERELARDRLTAALEIRQRLGHGCIEETRRALEDLRK